MLFTLLFLILLIFILLLLLGLNFILAKKNFKDREKMSSFECGFDSMMKNRLPFSLQFYLISIIFLIFDIEIAVILPYMFMSFYNYYELIQVSQIILLFLLIGLFMEWSEGALKWFK